MITTEYIIIGGGFSGMFMKKLLDEKKVPSILIDGQNLGGQLNLYLNKYIYDIPGIFKITAQDLLNMLKSSIDFHGVMENTVVKKIILEDKKKTVYAIKDNKEIILSCQYIIGASGKGIVEPVVLSYPGLEELYHHKKIFFTLNHKPKKIVAVLGGSDSALDAVEYFLKEGSSVYLIHRRNLTAMAGKIQMVANNPLYHEYLGVIIENFHYDNDKVIIKTNKETIEVDEVYMFYGLTTNDNGLTELWGSKKIDVNYDTMEPVDNQLLDYSIGDGAIYCHKRYLIHNYIGECYRVLKKIIDIKC